MAHGGVAMAQGGANNDGNHNEEWERLKMVLNITRNIFKR